MSEPTTETFAWQRPGDRFASGMVTAPGGPPAVVPPPPPEPDGPDGPDRRRRQMWVFAGIAGAILVIGSEGRGVRSRVRAVCDGAVRIPIQGPVGSLNASVAAAVLLFEARRQRGF